MTECIPCAVNQHLMHLPHSLPKLTFAELSCNSGPKLKETGREIILQLDLVLVRILVNVRRRESGTRKAGIDVFRLEPVPQTAFEYHAVCLPSSVIKNLENHAAHTYFRHTADIGTCRYDCTKIQVATITVTER